MSDSAAEAAEQDERDQQDKRDQRDERDQQVLRLGAAGLGRAEIAAALGMCPEALDQREAEDPRLATVLRGAAGLSKAWWEAIAREAFEAGRFNFVAACTREMQRRFGEGGPAKSKAGRDLRGERPRVRYVLPCNGMEKLNPDGTCPCDACQRGDPDDEDQDDLLDGDGDLLEDEE